MLTINKLIVNCEQNYEGNQQYDKTTTENFSFCGIKYSILIYFCCFGLSNVLPNVFFSYILVVELAHKNEAIKVVRLKDGLLKLSEAYVELANKCAIIFEAQRVSSMVYYFFY